MELKPEEREKVDEATLNARASQAALEELKRKEMAKGRRQWEKDGSEELPAQRSRLRTQTDPTSSSSDGRSTLNAASTPPSVALASEAAKRPRMVSMAGVAAAPMVPSSPQHPKTRLGLPLQRTASTVMQPPARISLPSITAELDMHLAVEAGPPSTSASHLRSFTSTPSSSAVALPPLHSSTALTSRPPPDDSSPSLYVKPDEVEWKCIEVFASFVSCLWPIFCIDSRRLQRELEMMRSSSSSHNSSSIGPDGRPPSSSSTSGSRRLMANNQTLMVTFLGSLKSINVHLFRAVCALTGSSIESKTDLNRLPGTGSLPGVFASPSPLATTGSLGGIGGPAARSSPATATSPSTVSSSTTSVNAQGPSSASASAAYDMAMSALSEISNRRPRPLSAATPAAPAFGSGGAGDAGTPLGYGAGPLSPAVTAAMTEQQIGQHSFRTPTLTSGVTHGALRTDPSRTGLESEYATQARSATLPIAHEKSISVLQMLFLCTLMDVSAAKMDQAFATAGMAFRLALSMNLHTTGGERQYFFERKNQLADAGNSAPSGLELDEIHTEIQQRRRMMWSCYIL